MRSFVAGRAQQQDRRIHRAGRQDNNFRGDGFDFVVALVFNRIHALAIGSKQQARGFGVQFQVELAGRQRGPHCGNVRVALGVNFAGKSVAGFAANAWAGMEVHGERKRKSLDAVLLKLGGNFGDHRFVIDRRKRKLRSPRRLGGIGSGLAMHSVKLLGEIVVWRQLLIFDWPSG